jgi:hypothetical protein
MPQQCQIERIDASAGMSTDWILDEVCKNGEKAAFFIENAARKTRIFCIFRMFVYVRF